MLLKTVGMKKPAGAYPCSGQRIPVLQHSRQNLVGTFGLLPAYPGFEHGNKTAHLLLGEPNVHRGTKMESKLAGRARHAGQGRNGRKLPALDVEVVASNNVRNRVLLQESVDDGNIELQPASLVSYASSRMSARCKRPPGLSTRAISSKACSFSGTRLSTLLEITTSTLALSTGRASDTNPA